MEVVQTNSNGKRSEPEIGLARGSLGVQFQYRHGEERSPSRSTRIIEFGLTHVEKSTNNHQKM